MTTFMTDVDSCLNCSYESSPTESSSSVDGYTALVESLLINDSHNMDDNLASPMSNYTYISSSMSPMSSTSEGSSYNLQSLSVNNDYNPNQINDYKYVPHLTVVEEPVEKFRFRYKSEMHGTHGSLLGRSSSSGKKTFPTVQLHNFYGHAIVRCSLSQLPSWRNPRPAPHSHSLVIRMGNEDKKDPHEVTLSPAQGYQAAFQGMGIIHTARKYIEDELYSKFKARLLFDKSQPIDDAALKSCAKREASEMNLNQVCLCFESFEQRDDDWVQICDPIYSKPINNMKSALTGELKITRLSSIVGNPSGGEEIFMFVEKVGKKNIKVRFCETDEPEHDLWEGWGKFTEADVHHQYGIALRTPKYKDGTLGKTEKVYIQLWRPSDSTLSEPLEFFYKSTGNSSSSGRKRARTTSVCSQSEMPTVITDDQFSTPDASSAFQDTDIGNIMETWSAIDWEKLSQFLDDDNTSNLAKDSVSSAAGDVNVLKEIDAFIQKTLKKMLTIMLMSAKKADFEKGRQYIEALFGDVKFRSDSVLDLAIKSNNPQYLSQLLEIIQKCRLQKVFHFKNEYGENCLHIACMNDRSEYIRLLMKNGANPNPADNNGNTPLHLAVQEQLIDCTTTLLSIKNQSPSIVLNQYNDDGYTPFHLAVANNNLTICQMLEEKALSDSVSIHDRVELKKGNSILHIAVEKHSIDVIRYMLKTKKIEINVQNASGHTALYLARTLDDEQKEEMVQLLLAYNAIDDEDSSEGEKEESPNRQGGNIQKEQSKVSTSEIKKNLISNQHKILPTDSCIDPQLLRKENPIHPLNLSKLCAIFNESEKWKSVAIELGYRIHIDDWQKRSDPAKMLFKFAEATRVPRSRLSEVFTRLNETNALAIIQLEE